MKNNKEFDIVEEESHLKNIKQNKKNINKLSFLCLIIFLLLEIMILLIICYSFKLIIDTKNLLIKQNLFQSEEKKIFINETNKLIIENKNLLKKIKIFKKINYKNELKFYRLLCPKEVIGKKKELYGIYGDGGYVLLDDLKNIKIAYSIGISNIISFDKDLADRGIDIFMYDHTIDKLPFNHSKFHWKKIGLTSELNKIEGMKTLNELLKENGHLNEKNMLLKIDIESNEWEILNEIQDNILNQFKYIILELHFIKEEEYELYFNCLKKLLKNHEIFHIHCCNCGSLFEIGENPICNILEISYIIREGNEFRKDNSIYPIKGFDYKICPEKENINKEQVILQFCDII